jgi:hypothetical protein
VTPWHWRLARASTEAGIAAKAMEAGSGWSSISEAMEAGVAVEARGRRREQA